MNSIVLLNTANLSREKWLESRRVGIGGSDAAAVCGLNPWKSALSVYMEKLGAAPERDDTEAMRQGRDLEDYVASRFEEATGKRTERVNAILQHPDYPWMVANIDRRVVGEVAGAECKTTAAWNEKEFDEEIPLAYQLQCFHYMAVTGADYWYLPVLFLNKAFKVYLIERDEPTIEKLIEIEAAFWERVQAQEPPDPDGSQDYTDMLKARYSSDNGAQIDLMDVKEHDMERLAHLKEDIKAITAQAKQIEQRIQAELGEAGAVEGWRGDWRARWSTVVSNRVDTARLKEKYPRVYRDCIKPSQSRRFTVARKERD